MVLAVACLFAACTKDGVYNPKEKISKIYQSSSTTYSGGGYDNTSTTPKHMTEAWTWDGKTVASISYYGSDGDLDNTVNFTYDGKRLQRIINSSKEYTEFTYDGKKIDKFETYEDGKLASTGTVTYDGKQIVQIDIVEYDSKAAKSPSEIAYMQTLMQVVMPVYTEKTAQAINTIATKGNDTYTIKFEWDGKNISKCNMDMGDGSVSITYTYDEMNNPYKGFLYILGEDGNTSAWGSKNNVTKEVITYNYDGETNEYTANYTYEYDGKWPVTKTLSESVSQNILGTTVTYSYTSVTYFEYAD